MARKVQIALILTEEEASRPRAAVSISSRKRKRKAAATTVGPPRRKAGMARPSGYGRNPKVIIEPWILMKAPTIKSALKYVRTELKALVPENQIHGDWFVVFYGGYWTKFMMLHGMVYARRMKGTMGERRVHPGLREVPCDACMWWTESSELTPILVGVSSAHSQEFRVCPDCVSEGVLDNTRKAGYIVRLPKE